MTHASKILDAPARRLLPGRPMIARWTLLATVLFSTACAGNLEQSTRHDLDAADARMAPDAAPEGKRQAARFDGSLAGYDRYALAHSPAVRASYDDWRAATERISLARRLPEPTFTYAYFVQSVETRVGPQRHRFSIQQAFPWPTKLSAGADAASYAARSAERRADATALVVTRRVADAYWKVWLVQRTRTVVKKQQSILQQLAGAVRARVVVGGATVADLAQVQLGISRVADSLAGLDEIERSASADLVAATGAPAGTATPVADADPPLQLPVEDEKSLRSAALAHPRVRAIDLMAKADDERARSAGADRYPGFVLGADYIETGPARMAGQADSGKDAVIVMLGLKLPLWGGTYGAEEAEAEADAAASRARESAARDDAVAELEKALSDVRDAARRIKLYREALVPQAQTVYASLATNYQTDHGNLASVLIGERDLLDLELSLLRARATHARAWARLEEIVGRPVHGRSPH